jgi:hypothetical protein
MRVLFPVVGLCLSVPFIACDNEDGDGACHDTSDCSGEEECSGPNDGPVCGIGPQRGCVTDADCGEGSVCHAVGDPCSFYGIGSNCDAPCTTDSCGEWFRCNASGACEVIPCDEGFTCPPHRVCDMTAVSTATAVYDRHAGCVNVTCTDDSQCTAEHACVNGICQTGLGHCEIPQAVP